MSDYWIDIVYVTDGIALMVVNYHDPEKSSIVADIEDYELEEYNAILAKHQEEIDAFKEKIYKTLLPQI